MPDIAETRDRLSAEIAKLEVRLANLTATRDLLTQALANLALLDEVPQARRRKEPPASIRQETPPEVQSIPLTNGAAHPRHRKSPYRDAIMSAVRSALLNGLDHKEIAQRLDEAGVAHANGTLSPTLYILQKQGTIQRGFDGKWRASAVLPKLPV